MLQDHHRAEEVLSVLPQWLPSCRTRTHHQEEELQHPAPPLTGPPAIRVSSQPLYEILLTFYLNIFYP